MKKRILSILLCLALVFTTACTASVPVAKAYHVDYGQEQFTYRDLRALEDRIYELETQLWAAHRMAQAARELGYDESHVIITTAQTDYRRIEDIRSEYIAIHDDLEDHWHEKELEYPAAAYVWKYFQDKGYNDVVIAGILGNMMVEVGGLTLDLKSNMRSNNYYGLCQWSKEYSKVWGTSLEEQCNFLEATMKYELDTYGYMYKKRYNYESFLLSKDIKDAALAFAKSYERCGSDTYKLRQQCAVEAYNYFVT